ncbi:hypothetical protein SAMN05444722_3405 [Rhodovulum sp. ES.010]|uniref:DUF2333 family protein n=1 Tax=Rhodovulum sp. ES.010 TaxID=1882821 RepID=UPI00092847AA|nr:DUF2333 family protein [Rhodovulum sp. ES.010]SIO54737.1 hypothetical protein SAMN05444722_3405 [Rhodovulum sp. ES.010]
MANDLIIRSERREDGAHGSFSGIVFGRKPKTILKRTSLMIVTAVVLYFGVFGTALQRIDADPDFMPTVQAENGSHAVDMLASLIEREVDTLRWAPNDPVFYPTAFHDNMANYQRGVMRAVSRFTLELETQIGRLNGTSAIDLDLQRAAGLLQFPTDIWLFDFQQSFLPVQPADSQYRAAAEALRAYNARVAAGHAAFETRPDALVLTLERMIGELGSRAAVIEQHTQQGAGLIDGMSDDIFYFNKGLSYATYLLVRELGRDFDRVISTVGIEAVWAQTLDSLRQAATQRPLAVLNSSGESSIFANHLHLQGFYMKRALLQLDEVVRVLRNTR